MHKRLRWENSTGGRARSRLVALLLIALAGAGIVFAVIGSADQTTPVVRISAAPTARVPDAPRLEPTPPPGLEPTPPPGLQPTPPQGLQPTPPRDTRGSVDVATASVSPAAGVPIPRSYFGLSIEYWDLPLLAQRPGTFVRVLDLLRVSDDGALVVRIGGDSAGHTLWRSHVKLDVGRLFVLTPRWFAELRAITATARLRLLLDLNLAAGSPAMAAAVTREALATLPARSILALEIGNEPDFDHHDQHDQLGEPAVLADSRVRTAREWMAYGADRYAAAFRSYAAALARTAPRIPVAGPELGNPVDDLGYLTRLLERDRRTLGLVTVHRYPYSACARRSTAAWPTIARVLSSAGASGLARSVQPAARIARAAGLPFRLTEVDSVTCGGRPGVSDTFATALWAPDALFSLLADGIGGANVHVRQGTFNEAFAITSSGLSPRPLLYGLLAFVRTLSNGRELLPTVVDAPAHDNLRVWTVRTYGDYLHVIALDKGPHAVRLALALPARGAATVELLTAPSVRAEHGTTLAGQTLNAAGRWTGRLSSRVLRPGRDGYVLWLRAYSAALVNVKTSL